MRTIAWSRVAPDGGAHRQQPFSRVAPLLAAALLLGAGGGFMLAAVLTITRATRTAGGPWWSALVQAHGHLQVYGWAGLFVLGVALHFLPRLRGTPLAFPAGVPWILGGLVAAMLLREICQPLVAFSGVGIWRVGLVASGVLECTALVIALVMLITTARSGVALITRPALWSVLPFLLCGFCALGVATVVNLVNVIVAANAATGLVPVASDDLNVTLGLLGFLVPVALAMSARALPMYAGLDAFPKRVLWPTAFTYIAGLGFAALGALSGDDVGTWSGVVHGLGLGVMGAMLIVYVAIFVRLMRSRGRLPRRVTDLASAPREVARKYQTQISTERGAFGPFVALVSSAYMWAILGGTLLVIDGLAQMVGVAPPINPDAARHSLAVGFIALLICGVAPRMVPGFSGGRIASPRLVSATLWLGNGAALLRVGSLLAAPALAALGGFGTTLDQVAFGLSGPTGLALAICLAVNLWPAIWPTPQASKVAE